MYILATFVHKQNSYFSSNIVITYDQMSQINASSIAKIPSMCILYASLSQKSHIDMS